MPSASLADYLFLHMTVTYGHRWTSQYGEDPRGAAGRIWAAEFADMSKLQVDDAIAACRRSSDEWPPSMPLFRKLCLGIPDFGLVRADIGKREHGFTRLVWTFLDTHLFSRSDTRDAERQLRAAYDYAVERRMCGDDLPPPRTAITHDEPPPYVKPTPEERMAQILKAHEALQA